MTYYNIASKKVCKTKYYVINKYNYIIQESKTKKEAKQIVDFLVERRKALKQEFYYIVTSGKTLLNYHVENKDIKRW